MSKTGSQQMLPHEIIDTIADIWPGRGLNLTCRRLSVRANAEKYIVKTHIETSKNVRRPFTATKSQLPDGTFHGVSIVRVCAEAPNITEEHICYSFGRLMWSDLYRNGVLLVHSTVISDYVCSWGARVGAAGEILIHDGRNMVKAFSNLSLDDAIIIARKWVKESPAPIFPPRSTTYFPGAGEIFPSLIY